MVYSPSRRFSRFGIACVLIACCLNAAKSYNTMPSRRAWMKQVSVLVTTLSTSSPVLAAEDPRASIREAQSTLATLLENWQRATIDCTYADVPRELLEQKNKELLLEKASTYALFDKSVSVETCKTTNRVVRDYLGVTGKGPLVGIEKKLKQALDFVDGDQLDDYMSEMESFSQNMSRASSLSYTAGMADFESVNNFAKDEVDNLRKTSNLEQSRGAIVDAKASLDRMAGMID